MVSLFSTSQQMPLQRFQFSTRFLFLLVSLGVVVSTTYMHWIVPWRKQQGAFERIEDVMAVGLEKSGEVGWLKRGIACLFGKHSALSVVELIFIPDFGHELSLISNFPRLKELWVSGQESVDSGLMPILELHELEILHFERCRLDDISSLAILANLDTLTFEEASTGRGIGSLGQAPKLRVLHLFNSEIKQVDFDGLAESDTIEELSLELAAHAIDLSKITQMEQLKKLRINWNTVGLDFSHLESLNNLQMLFVCKLQKSDNAVMDKLKAKGVNVSHFEMTD